MLKAMLAGKKYFFPVVIRKKKSKWDRIVIKYKATANKILTDVAISIKKILYLLTPNVIYGPKELESTENLLGMQTFSLHPELLN